MSKSISIILTLLLLLCLAGCSRQTGWVTENGTTYYLDESGNRLTGWHEIDGARHFFDGNGVMATGWLTDDGKTYFLLEDGKPLSGWLGMDGRRCYFSPDGVMAQGWTQIGGLRYYFDTDGSLATGRLEVDGTVYLLDGDGAPVTGWQELDGKTSYFRADGSRATGWEEIGGKRFRFSDTGEIVTGKQTLEDGTYLLQEDGSAYTGWHEENGFRYYYQENGAMAVGKVLIDGENAYFAPNGIHVLLVNPWNKLPEGYEVELKKVESYEVAAVCSAALTQMLADCRRAGFSPAICSTYRTYEDQEFLYERKVKRVMATGYEEEEARKIAATEVAVPGTSEHQLGLAVDLVDNNNWMLDETQAAMPTQKWLMEHCWEYGFILRYPIGSTDITGIIYEPWHYRYVGLEMALELRDLGITLEEYLGAADHE